MSLVSPNAESAPAAVATPLEESRAKLWRLSYRLTGVAADADEVVQEAFTRALEERATTGREVGEGWLVRVATNLSLDCLRRRKRRRYPGPWLPSPIELELDDAEPQPTVVGVENRYEELESLSYAFLLALEVLGPRQRAVLILRDVLDVPAAEVARTLGTSEANVRILHHRARRRIEASDRDRSRSLRDVAMDTRRALESLLSCLLRQDAAGLEAMLAESARTVTDGGGQFAALRRPMAGRQRVARFHLQVARERAPISRFEIRSLNGVPALVIETTTRRRQQAPRIVLRCELDVAGRIREIQSIVAPRKLTAVRFAGNA